MVPVAKPHVCRVYTHSKLRGKARKRKPKHRAKSHVRTNSKVVVGRAPRSAKVARLKKKHHHHCGKKAPPAAKGPVVV